MNERSQEVKNYFENTEKYLGTTQLPIGIQSRISIIQAMLKGHQFDRVLDAPCGNGMIAKHLKEVGHHFTLVDIASNMVELAAQNIDGEIKNLDLIQGDIMGMDFDHQFDLILAIGILAHISDPSAFIARIDQLLRPGGTLVIQNTDDQHFVIKVQKLIRQQKQLSQSGLYDMNTIPHEWLMNQFDGLNYRLEQMYRYETKIPFLSSNKDPLSGIWKVFGVPPKNTFSFLGSKCIYKFKKP